MKNKKILIIQTAFLGDVILALPMVQSIKAHLSDALVDFLCIPSTESALQNHPAINKIIPYDKKGGDKLDKFIEVLNEIREVEYDIVISPHRFLRSSLLTYYSESKVRIGFEENSMAFLLTNKVKYIKDKHEIYRNLELVKQIPGLEYDEKKVSLKPELYASTEQKENVRHLLVHKSNLISFAPCSKWFSKQLPIEKAAEIAKILMFKGYNIALVGGEADIAYCTELEDVFKDDSLMNLCGKLSPLESYEVMTYSKALITVDSAAQHLGSASGIPVVLIYGSTDISFGFYPLTSKYKIAEIDSLECRPCTDHGRDKCPLGHFKCMVDLSAEKIVDMMEEIM
ncbi:MAG: glycosyltransferase family 9 protein [Ignavibacteria bacterium]|nr:glycosyltransferase family 9 protein [Ignavibacteria bacterium]